jgi:histidine kinase
MASYLVVIVVGVVTLGLTVESAAPTAFNRHLLGMQGMMGQMGTQQMEADLFANFRAAVTESLLLATVAALITAIVVSFFVSQRVVIPIRQMMQASQRIAAGHYRERVQVSSEDELGQLAHSFNQMAATLEQTESMRQDLIANVAHELRTPLATIKGYMEGLIDGVFPAQAETYQLVYREADRLQRLVKDLQALSQVEAGAFSLDYRPVALTALIYQTAERLRPQFEDKGVKLELDLALDLPLTLADEDRLSQVLLNLAGNALQYTPAGGVVTITTHWQTTSSGKPDRVLIAIADTGLGIPTEHLPHIFTRFYRVDKSRSRAGGGSGIGLTIAKHLVEAHDGQIWAESVGTGQGSVFRISLPVKN